MHTPRETYIATGRKASSARGTGQPNTFGCQKLGQSSVIRTLVVVPLTPGATMPGVPLSGQVSQRRRDRLNFGIVIQHELAHFTPPPRLLVTAEG
jgi:hypothetical protein